MNNTSTTASVLKAANFAARKHRDQRRKGADGAPYINHPIEVTELLVSVGGVEDLVTLQSSLLHDTVEDTDATFDDIEMLFGREVRDVVAEVTDDKDLPKAERKRLQIEHAPHISPKAKLIKLADKISNVRELTENPPADWHIERRAQYLDWAEQVVAAFRGSNGALEQLFDQAIAEGRTKIETDVQNPSAARL